MENARTVKERPLCRCTQRKFGRRGYQATACCTSGFGLIILTQALLLDAGVTSVVSVTMGPLPTTLELITVERTAYIDLLCFRLINSGIRLLLSLVKVPMASLRTKSASPSSSSLKSAHRIE